MTFFINWYQFFKDSCHQMRGLVRHSDVWPSNADIDDVFRFMSTAGIYFISNINGFRTNQCSEINYKLGQLENVTLEQLL